MSVDVDLQPGTIIPTCNRVPFNAKQINGLLLRRRRRFEPKDRPLAFALPPSVRFGAQQETRIRISLQVPSTKGLTAERSLVLLPDRWWWYFVCSASGVAEKR